ncbi:MAG TPA: hypothetical protein VFH68_17980 [Polyangia bacterium]|jgi:hypothetical protein|nr:hypothetical protein [Polyangia bacterium]
MSEPRHVDKHTEIRHLLRTVSTALELAIVARAPTELLNRLARASGLLAAVIELPLDAASPAGALFADLIADAHVAVTRWEAWQRDRAASA